MKNNDLVDIIYSESIERYVIILKRFPDIPIIIAPGDISNIMDLLYYDNNFGIVYICDINDIEHDEIYNGLLISNKYNKIYSSKVSNDEVIYEEGITELERNEIINKLVEIYNKYGDGDLDEE